MKELKLVLFAALIGISIVSCTRNPLKVKLSGNERDIAVLRFDEELFHVSGKDTLQHAVKLSNAYPHFFNLFTYRIINIGGIADSTFPAYFKYFLTDTMIRNVKKEVDAQFSDFQKTEKDLIKAFKYYQVHFPEKELPTIYTYVSGFNQSVVTAEEIVGISLDKYLGRDCAYYRQLGTLPMYKISNMHKKKIPSDVAFAWAITEFGEGKATNLLGNMIQKGKLMYFVDALLPETHDTLKIGYTAKQLQWCETNEDQMWTYLIEKDMLYSNKRMDIIRYTNDAPSTSGFPQQSPGRAGVWIGWQIVRKYMKEHPELTLAELMDNHNYQQILNDSAYYPE